MTAHDTSRDADGEQRLKLVIAGDGGCGKTILLCAYMGKELPEGYNPTVLDVYSTNIEIKGTDTPIEIMDTAGQEDLEKIRTLAYPGSHCIILCYDVLNQTSMRNATTFWHNEIRATVPNVPIVLSGNKLDLKDTKPHLYVTSEQVKENTKKMKHLKACLQCSAYDVIAKNGKNEDSVDRVFQHAILAAMHFRNDPPGGCSFFCNLL